MQVAKNRRLLVVDDNTDIHADFRKILCARSESDEMDSLAADIFADLDDEGTQDTSSGLADHDFQIDTATQGRQGLELVEKSVSSQQHYALAFVDVRMPPGWDGVETSVKLWEADPELQIVICTAYSDYQWHEMVEELGHRDRLMILKKPFDAIEVRQMSHSLARKWQLRRAAEFKMDDLEKMVARRTRELEQVNDKLANSFQRVATLNKQLQRKLRETSSEGQQSVKVTRDVPSTERPLDPEMLDCDMMCWKCGRRYDNPRDICPSDQTELLTLSPTEKQDAHVGVVLGERYRTCGLLGAGGMSRVYRARQLDFSREVAIKILRSELPSDDRYCQRFIHEAQTLANLSHPNVIRLYDFGQRHDGAFYMVMELLRGQSLGKRLREAPLTLGQIFDVMLPITSALGEAHAHGIIHRDLKPDNIFLLEVAHCTEPLPKLLDFGIAKQREQVQMTHEGDVVGTPIYMSPEQIQNREVTAASDLYSLGVVLYELICGAPPFMADSFLSVCLHHLQQQPEALRALPGLETVVPEELDELVGLLLSKEPAERLQDTHALGERLRDIREFCRRQGLLDVAPALEHQDYAGAQSSSVICDDAATSDAAALQPTMADPSTDQLEATVRGTLDELIRRADAARGSGETD